MRGLPSRGASPLRPVPDPDEGAFDEPEAPDLASLVERAYLIAVGLASLAATAIVEAVAGSADPETPRRADDVVTNGLPVMTGAALGLAAEAGAMAVRAGLQAVRSAGGFASGLLESFAGVERSHQMMEQVARVDERGRRERDRAEEAADAFATVLIPPIVDALLDRFDLTEIVAERVDLNAVVAGVDLNGVVDRVDLMRAVDRIDLNDIAARLDVQAVIDRVDLVGIAESLIAELDLTSIIREATGAMSAETVDGIRVLGRDGDRLVARVVDRLLSRTRDAASPSPTDGEGVGP